MPKSLSIFPKIINNEYRRLLVNMSIEEVNIEITVLQERLHDLRNHENIRKTEILRNSRTQEEIELEIKTNKVFLSFGHKDRSKEEIERNKFINLKKI